MKDVEFHYCHCQIFHSAITQMLQPLKTVMTEPEAVWCPNGHFCSAAYSLGPCIGDYPEQALHWYMAKDSDLECLITIENTLRFLSKKHQSHSFEMSGDWLETLLFVLLYFRTITILIYVLVAFHKLLPLTRYSYNDLTRSLASSYQRIFQGPCCNMDCWLYPSNKHRHGCQPYPWWVGPLW